MPSSSLNILFILNPGSGGKNKTDWEPIIRDYFAPLPHQIKFYLLDKDPESAIEYWIEKFSADRVVSVGGDGTVSLLGKILQGKNIPLGILRGGSANGMAEEMGIPTDPKEALDIIVADNIQTCDAICINEDSFCFHLSDAGMNAQLVKYFEDSDLRGMWNYARMFLKALINKSLMKVHVKADGMDEIIKSYMIVIANASKYGTGAVINPKGIINDGKFELVFVKKIALSEFIKLFWSYKKFNPEKVEIIKTSFVEITSKKNIHFQVDGEYKGKIKNVTAKIIPEAVQILVPEKDMDKK
ncbi:MAG: diacylglycerol kinase family protein [Ginsengibacter sp.]